MARDNEVNLFGENENNNFNVNKEVELRSIKLLDTNFEASNLNE